MQGKESVLAALQCRGLEAGEHCRGEDGLATPFWQFESALISGHSHGEWWPLHLLPGLLSAEALGPRLGGSLSGMVAGTRHVFCFLCKSPKPDPLAYATPRTILQVRHALCSLPVR